MIGHDIIDRRIITMHRVIGRMIENDPKKKLLFRAKSTLRRWQKTSPDYVPYQEWEQILNGDWKDIREKLGEKSDRMQTLRQASPFAGCLPQEVRIRIIQKYYRKCSET